VSTAIVTGAARGIGRAIALRLAGDFDHLVVVDLSPTLADTTLELETLGVEVTPVEANLVTAEGVAAVAEATTDVTALVNNAGITRDSRLVNMEVDDFRAVLDVNLGAPFRLIESLAGKWTDSAAIVNISSRAYLGNFGQFNYSMSKGGLVGLTRAMSLSLAPHVRVNAIAPGLIGTEMAMSIPDNVLDEMVAAIPLARMGSPEEIANVVWFLLTPLSSYITGHVLVVGGGRSLG
jgi:3-oxoacyl-[acyl-carrier protein] reductase